MSLGAYDSPTFLNQKDKYLLGLSLPEMMVAMVIAGGWFLFLLFFPLGMIFRLILILPLTGISLVFLFFKLAGLSIPMYLFLSILRIFRKPSFEENQENLVLGESAWLEAQRLRQDGGGGRFAFLKKGRRLASSVPEARQAEMKAEMDKQVTEGAVAAENWARDAARSLLKGG